MVGAAPLMRPPFLRPGVPLLGGAVVAKVVVESRFLEQDRPISSFEVLGAAAEATTTPESAMKSAQVEEEAALAIDVAALSQHAEACTYQPQGPPHLMHHVHRQPQTLRNLAESLRMPKPGAIIGSRLSTVQHALNADMSPPTQSNESSERVQMPKSVPNTLAVHTYSLSLRHSFTWCVLHFCAANQIYGLLYWICIYSYLQI
jgi:hypothetical protein